jgi:hypothetical protein
MMGCISRSANERRRGEACGGVWPVAAVAVVSAGLVIARVALAGAVWDRVWAEDGQVFLADSSRSGLVSTFDIYSGQAHVVPRLLSYLGAQLQLQTYAIWVTVSSTVITGLLAAFVFVAARRVLGSCLPALVAALGLVLAPAARVSNLADLANLQWFLIPSAFWALLLPRNAAKTLTATGAAVAFFAAASAPLTLLVTPAALVHRRRALRSVPLIACAAGLGVQAASILWAPHSPTSGVSRHPTLRVDVATAMDQFAAVHVSRNLAIVAGVGLIAVPLLATLRVSPAQHIALLATGCALTLFVVTTVVTGSPNPRYAAAVEGLLAGGLGAALVGASWRVSVSALALPVVLLVAAFPAASYRASGPSWAQQVVHARVACARPGIHKTRVLLSPARWGVAELDCRGINTG